MISPCQPSYAVELFGPRLSYEVCRQPAGVGVGDFNGDGAPDLGLACYGALGILLSDGQGGFERAPDIRLPQLASIVVGDLDGDGALDLIAGEMYSQYVHVLLGDGEGGFCAKYPDSEECVSDQRYLVGSSPGTLSLADFNGDGHLDLVAALKNDKRVTVLTGDGEGGFNAPGTTVRLGAQPWDIAVDDFDQDGDQDVVTANLLSDTVTLLFGDGAGGFRRIVPIEVGGGPRAVVAADFDLDGDPDLAVARNGDNSVKVLLNTSGGVFQEDSDIEVGEAPVWVGVADMDANEHPDLLVVNVKSNSLSVLRNDGRGGFAKAQDIEVAGGPGVAAAAEFDGDGILDLVVVHRTTGTIGFLPGDGLGGFGEAPVLEVPPFSSGFPYGCAVIRDLDGNGHADVAVAGGEASAIRVFLSDGRGRFLASGTDIETPSPGCLSAADLDADGDIDLVTPRAGNEGRLDLLYNDGAGGFTSGVTLEVRPRPVGVAIGDVDANGWPDLAVAHDDLGGRFASFILRDDQGGFLPHRPIQTCRADKCNAEYVTLVDIDADGMLDLLVTNFAARNLGLLRGNGDGTFELKDELVLADQPGWVAAIDLDGDDVKDLVFTSYDDSRIGTLLADGPWSFKDGTMMTVQKPAKGSVLGDFNADGVPDVAVPLPDGNAVALLLGDGDGGFTRAPDVATRGRPTSTVAGELDGDVHPDLAVCNTADGTVNMLLNRLPDRADVNGSNRIDGFDLVEIATRSASSFGDAAYRRTVDVNLDGSIDGDDQTHVADGFGRLVSPPSPLRASLAETEPALDGTITFQPHAAEGNRVTVEVRVNDDDPVAAASFAVEFAPSDSNPDPVLEYLNYNPGTYFSGGAMQTIDIAEVGSSRIEVTVQRIPPEDLVRSGQQPLIYLVFAARRVGSAILSFEASADRAGPALLNRAGDEIGGVEFGGPASISVGTIAEGAHDARIDVKPLELDFGAIPTGTVATRTLRISNLGFSDLRVSDVWFDPDLVEFRSFFTTAFDIPPFGLVDLRVQCAATSAGEFESKLWIRSNDAHQEELPVKVLAIAVAP